MQQDGQEFMKLFLTLLETKFAMQREVEVRGGRAASSFVAWLHAAG